MSAPPSLRGRPSGLFKTAGAGAGEDTGETLSLNLHEFYEVDSQTSCLHVRSALHVRLSLCTCPLKDLCNAVGLSHRFNSRDCQAPNDKTD